MERETGTVTVDLQIIGAGLAGFQATLTLPGIAGIVLTIGMAVDANVLIFERIREEVRKGKTIKASIDQGQAIHPVESPRLQQSRLVLSR